MRWLVLTDDHVPTPGGVAIWTARVVEELRRRGHEVEVFARARPGLSDDVVGVRGPSFGRRGHLAMTLATLGARRRVPPERILCTTWTVVPKGLAGAHVVVHGSDVTRPAHDPARRGRVLARSRVWAVSSWLARQVPHARVLPAPVPVAPTPSLHGERWLWAGRCVVGKGGDRFARWVRAAGVEADLLGDGPLRSTWAATAPPSLRFQGWVAEPGPWLRRARLLALCPDRPGPRHGAEGLGLVGLEAMGQGTPVVGVAVGGVVEAVGPGLVVPRPDDPADVAARVEAWWDPLHGRRAWEWVGDHHGAARTVDTLEAR